jgi:ceramide glucosyltransferase
VPSLILHTLALLAGLIAMAGIAQCLAGWWAVRRFARTAPPPAPDTLPPILLLKPLHGDEPRLEAALASACAQDYPDLRLVFGVQRPDDAAIPVVHRLQQRFPDRAITLVIDPTPHGLNGKVANLINMLAAIPAPAADSVVVIADSDMHAAPDWLRHVAAALAQPGTGLVTTLYTGLAARIGLPELLGSSAISHSFLPGALLARAMGRQDCFGATMALRADTLAAIGGLPALSDHLADDNELGRLVRARGQTVALAATIPATTVAEPSFAALLSHELRWARTIRALVPAAFALSAIQYPIAWAILALTLTGHDWALATLAVAWAARVMAARGIDRALGPAAGTRVPTSLLPLRDLLSLGLVVAAHAGRRVRWRGAVLNAPAR